MFFLSTRKSDLIDFIYSLAHIVCETLDVEKMKHPILHFWV